MAELIIYEDEALTKKASGKVYFGVVKAGTSERKKLWLVNKTDYLMTVKVLFRSDNDFEIVKTVEKLRPETPTIISFLLSPSIKRMKGLSGFLDVRYNYVVG